MLWNWRCIHLQRLKLHHPNLIAMASITIQNDGQRWSYGQVADTRGNIELWMLRGSRCKKHGTQDTGKSPHPSACREANPLLARKLKVLYMHNHLDIYLCALDLSLSLSARTHTLMPHNTMAEVLCSAFLKLPSGASLKHSYTSTRPFKCYRVAHHPNKWGKYHWMARPSARTHAGMADLH